MTTFEAVEALADLLKTHLRANKGEVGKKRLPTELKQLVDFTLPQVPFSHHDLLADLKNYLELTPNTSTPQFQNQLFSGLNPYAMLAEWLSVYTNSTMATFEVAPFATLVEKELINHLIKKIGWANGEGIMVTGGSNANFSAMLIARNNLYPHTKWDGMDGKKFVAFVSEEAHYSFDKAMNMLGMGLRFLKKVPSDSSGKMIPSELRAMIQASLAAGEIPYFIGATAGTTVFGAYDPIEEISEIAREFNLWFHVDGAWGGSVLLTSEHRHLMRGIQNVDSLALDTHKMLGTGLISSFFLTKHLGALRKSNDSGGSDYIFHEPDAVSCDTGPLSLQCGRRVDALKVWLMWRALGDSGIEKMINKFFQNAHSARKLIESKEELELIHEPEMLNVCFTFKNKTKDIKKSRETLLSEGSFYVNISTRKGVTFFRMILVNPSLTSEIIENTLDRIIKLGVS